MTGRLASSHTGANALLTGAARLDSDLAAYRGAVADVLAELAAGGKPPTVAAAERVLARRLAEPEFEVILSATPPGPQAARGADLPAERQQFGREPGGDDPDRSALAD